MLPPDGRPLSSGVSRKNRRGAGVGDKVSFGVAERTVGVGACRVRLERRRGRRRPRLRAHVVAVRVFDAVVVLVEDVVGLLEGGPDEPGRRLRLMNDVQPDETPAVVLAIAGRAPVELV